MSIRSYWTNLELNQIFILGFIGV